MSLFTPLVLLWLVPLLGFIVALYLLKMKRRDVIVPASFLWPSKVEEIRANSLFQRLRFSLLLLLQLLAAIAICLCLARPQMLRQGITGRSTVVIIDSSLTMGATDVAPSRLEVAKQKAREIVNAAAPGDRLAVIEAGASPRILSPLANDPVAQMRAINQIGPTDAPPSVGEALRIGAALVGSDPSGRLILVSDGAFGQVPNFNAGKALVVFESVGANAEDLAITALGATETPHGPEVYCAVRNLGKNLGNGVINVYADGHSIHSERIAPSGGQLWSTTFSAPPQATLIEAKLDSTDILKADNYAAVALEKGASIRTLLVSPGDPFTERALALDPRVVLDRSPHLPDSEKSPITSHYDLIVFDGVPETPVAAPGVLVLGSAVTNDQVQAAGTASSLRFVSKGDSAVLNAVDLGVVQVSKAQKLVAKTAEVVAQSSQGPEVLLVRGAQRRIYLSFLPLESNFPLQPGFPIFIANALTYLGGTGETGFLVVHPGSPFTIPAQGDVKLTDPDGRGVEVPVKNGLATITGITRVETYALESNGKKRTIYSSLREAPLALSPSATIRAGGGQILAAGVAMGVVDVWRPVAFGLLALLALEWLIFARRS